MRRAPAAGKKCAHPAGQHKSVSKKPRMRSIFVAEWQQTLRYCANSGVCGAFSFAIGTLRGQDYPHAPSPRAKLQATWVRGPTDDGRSSPQGSAGSIGLIGGCDGVGASRPRSRLWPSECAREYAAVDEQVLPGDVAGLGGAQKGAGGAEFIRAAETLGWHRRHARGLRLLDRNALALGIGHDVRVQPFGVEGAGQQEI